MAAAAVLVALLVPLAAVAALGTPSDGLVALQMASIVSAVALLLMAQAFDRQILADLALVRRPAGEVVETPFEATGDDPRDAARRALAVAGRSLAPNQIVIAVDEERGVLRAHQLVPEERA